MSPTDREILIMDGTGLITLTIYKSDNDSLLLCQGKFAIHVTADMLPILQKVLLTWSNHGKEAPCAI